MWSVFPTTLHWLKVFIFIKLIVSVRVSEAMDASIFSVDVHPQRTVRVKEALCTRDVNIEFLYLDLFTARIDPVKPFVSLVASNNASLVIYAYRDP